MEKRVEKYEPVLKALANSRRLAIVAFLKKKKRATVGEIAKHIKLSFRSTSKHLSILQSVEAVSVSQMGLYRHYALNPEAGRFTKSLIALL